MFRNLLAFLFTALTSLAMADDNWTRFRGSDGTGVAADDERLPTHWTTTENVLWSADIPGIGWSSPVVWGHSVFLTSVVSDAENEAPKKGLYLGQGVREPAKGNHQWLVHCFDLATGAKRWEHAAHVGRPTVPRHPKSSYAAETPTTDGQRLYVLFGDVGLYCYDLEGKPLWSQNIEARKTLSDYGAAASPVVYDDQVIVVYDNLEGSWIGAFDAQTGQSRWRVAREETHSWATPLVWKNEQRTEIVVPGKRGNRSYSLDGELLWEFDGRMSNLVIPSPFVAHGFCYITSGYVRDNRRPVIAIKPGATGKFGESDNLAESEFVAWFQPQAGPYNPSPIVYGDYYYTLLDQGFLTCHEAKTGKEVFDKQRFSPSGSFTASPWAYNGKIFCLSEDGLTYVVQAGPEFKLLETSALEELCLSSPAVSQGKLLLRTASKLYCISQAK